MAQEAVAKSKLTKKQVPPFLLFYIGLYVTVKIIIIMLSYNVCSKYASIKYSNFWIAEWFSTIWKENHFLFVSCILSPVKYTGKCVKKALIVHVCIFILYIYFQNCHHLHLLNNTLSFQTVYEH